MHAHVWTYGINNDSHLSDPNRSSEQTQSINHMQIKAGTTSWVWEVYKNSLAPKQFGVYMAIGWNISGERNSIVCPGKKLVIVSKWDPLAEKEVR